MASSYHKKYVFPLPLTDAWKEEITLKTRGKLTDMLGVEVDNVMAVRRVYTAEQRD